MRKRILMLYAVFLILVTTPNVYCETIPPNLGELTQDYYDVSGEPLLSASVMGNLEFESGETSKIFIQLTNDGQIHTFETDKEPKEANEFMDALTELDLEYDITTAINIRGVLENRNGAPIRVFSDLQEAGSLRSGETSQPMEFNIEIFENAPSGTYELTLNLTYQYQNEVKVEGHPDQEFDFWYITKNKMLPIYIKVKPRADFEIESFNSQLLPDKEGLLYITYKNVGDEVAEDAVARIDVQDPFSTTDDEAFLGTLNPGDSYEAQFLIEVDTDALPKTYGIDTEVEYKDGHGDTRISDIMKAQVKVDEPLSLGERIASVRYLVVIAAIVGAAGLYIYIKRGKKGVQ